MKPSRTISGRIAVIAAVRAGYGAVLLLAPQRLLTAGTHAPVPAFATAVARVLGARQVLQAAVTVTAPTGPVVGAGAAVDVLHGLSGVGLALVSPRWRRIALADAVLAMVLAATAARRISDD